MSGIPGVLGVCAMGLPTGRPIVGMRWMMEPQQLELAPGSRRIHFTGSQIGRWMDGDVLRPVAQTLEVQLDTLSARDYADDAVHGWPPPHKKTAPVGYYPNAGISEYAGRADVGLGHVKGRGGGRRFPRWSGGVDGIPGVNKDVVLGRDSILGQTVTVIFERDDLPEVIKRPSRKWSWRQTPCGPSSHPTWEWSSVLPPGFYWNWTISLEGLRGGDVHIPVRVGPWGECIDPVEPWGILTEFAHTPGTSTVRISGIAYRLLNDPDWLLVERMLCHYPGRADVMPGVAIAPESGAFVVRTEPGLISKILPGDTWRLL